MAAAAPANAASPVGTTTDDSVKAFAVQWYTQMQAGKFDRSQYATAYGAQLTDEAVQAMSKHLNVYGASPLRAEIMKKRTVENSDILPGEIHIPARRCGEPFVRLRWLTDPE